MLNKPVAMELPIDTLNIDKALGQFRLALNGVFIPFSMYGLQAHIPEAIETIIQLALIMHSRLLGVDPSAEEVMEIERRLEAKEAYIR